MTREVQYIIEHKKFPGAWTDYLPYVASLVPLAAAWISLKKIFTGSTWNDIIWGIASLLSFLLLACLIIKRIRNINTFIELKTSENQQHNFMRSVQIIKAWRDNQSIRKLFGYGIYRATHVETDPRNNTINATLAYHSIFGRSYLTIVCIENAILVNERHEPLWFMPLGGVKEFEKLLLV